jgi:hypothetical protein
MTGNRSFQGFGLSADLARRLDDLARSISSLERQVPAPATAPPAKAPAATSSMTPVQTVVESGGGGGSATVTLSTQLGDSADLVRGGAALTTANAIPVVTAAGTLGQSAMPSVSLTNQAAAISPTALQVAGGVAPAGIYRISMYLVCSVAGTGSAVITVHWNDGVQAQASYGFGGALISLGAFQQIMLILVSDGVNDITYSATYTGGAGAAYNFKLVMEKIA